MARQNWNSEVFVLDPDGSKLGKMQYSDAQELAKNRYNLDLVQVNKNNNLPVYKIMDHGEHKYNKRKHQKRPTTHHLKEMGFRVCIDPHDMKTKINHIQRFLSKGNDVKISVTMRGREKSRPELAHDRLGDILSELGYSGDLSSDTIHIQPIKSFPSSVGTIVRPARSDKSHGKNREITETTSRDNSPVGQRD